MATPRITNTDAISEASGEPELRTNSRRSFLAALSAATAGVAALGSVPHASAADAPKEKDGDAPAVDPAWGGAPLDSPPSLQNPAADAVTVVWAVRGPATGWVEYGPTEALGQRASAGPIGLEPVADRFLSARLTGLTPGKPVYYRVAAATIAYKNAYSIARGETAVGPIHRFTPLGAAAESAGFAMLNDTHADKTTLAGLFASLEKNPADVLAWNGDVVDDVRSEDQIVEQYLRPAGAFPYAASHPVLFTSGNHDVRGVLARRLPQAATPWAHPEASPEEPLGRCFALRHGPLAIVGLDTGEDKPDAHPVFAGLARFEPYREAQAAWLAKALLRPEIAGAPYLVAFCHIPLWGKPGQNGGDSLDGYALYSEQGQALWHPLLQKAGCQLLLCGHTHQFRVDAANDLHSYPQIVGGGPKPEQATILRGRAGVEKLELVAHKLDGSELGRWSFAPRRG